MGCITRVGCLVLIVAIAIVAWLTHDRWLHIVRGDVPHTTSSTPWEPLTADRAARAHAALAQLQSPSGPVYANLTGAEAASYVYQALTHAMPSASDSAAAAVIGNALVLRANVPTSELGGASTLGSIASVLRDREPVQFAGTMRIVSPGLAEFAITNVQVRNFSVPASLIPQIVARISRGSRPAGLSANGLPLVLPSWIADVRIANGKITVYKNT